MNNLASGLNPGLNPPRPLKLTGNLLENWREFLTDFRLYIKAAELNGKPREDVKKAAFLNLIGPEGFELYKNKNIRIKGEKLTLASLIDGYQHFFERCQTHNSVAYNSIKFENRNQLEGESFDDYIRNIYNLAAKCQFNDWERRIRDKILGGINDPNLKMKLLGMTDLSLSNITSECKKFESQKNEEKSPPVPVNDEQEFFYRKFFDRPFPQQADISRDINDPPTDEELSDEEGDNGNDLEATVHGFDDERMETVSEERDLQNGEYPVKLEPEPVSDEPSSLRSTNTGSQVKRTNVAKPSRKTSSKPKNTENYDDETSEDSDCTVIYEVTKSGLIGSDQRNQNFTNGNENEKRKKFKRTPGNFSCNKCERSFPSEISLKHHGRAHKPKPFKCKVCHNKFAYQKRFKKHEATCKSSKH